jgi:hypothetical protein
MACGLRMRAACLPRSKGDEDVGDQPVLRPVTAADDVAGTHRGHRHTVPCGLGLKKMSGRLR